VDKSYFETGTLTSYSSSDPLLWGYQYGSGPLMSFTSYDASTTGGIFFVDNDGGVGMGTSTISSGSLLTVGYNSGSQFLVNNAGVVTEGTWQGSSIGLAYGGLGGDFSGSDGFLYVNGGTAIASTTLDIGHTNLVGGSGINLNNNVLSLNTAGNWTGTLDGIDGADIFTLAAWFGTSSAPQLINLENLATVGTITTGTWEGSVIDVTYGGTGKASWSKQGILYASSTGEIVQIATGSPGRLLAVADNGYGYKWVNTGSVGVDTNDRVAIDSSATAGYLGAGAGDGVFRTNSTLFYTDGGDYITIGVANDSIGNTQLQYDTGQNLTSTSSPTFNNLTLSGLNMTGWSDGLLTIVSGSMSTTSNNTANWDAVYASSTNYDITYNTVNASSSKWDEAYNKRVDGADDNLTFTNNRIGVASGYEVPTTGNITNWNTAYVERGSQIAGTNLSWNGSALDVSDSWYDSFEDMSLTEGYVYVGSAANHP